MPDEQGGPLGAEATRLMLGLRAYAADYTELTRHLADWLGVHAGDAAALAEILWAEDRDDPLTPARLARRVHLSSGATSALLNRLERAGLLVRTREASDRRVVTLRSAPAVAVEARAFFAPLGRHVGAALGAHPAAEVAAAADLLEAVHRAMADAAAEVAALPPRGRAD